MSELHPHISFSHQILNAFRSHEHLKLPQSRQETVQNQLQSFPQDNTNPWKSHDFWVRLGTSFIRHVAISSAEDQAITLCFRSIAEDHAICFYMVNTWVRSSQTIDSITQKSNRQVFLILCFWEQTGKFPMVLWRSVSYDSNQLCSFVPGWSEIFKKKKSTYTAPFGPTSVEIRHDFMPWQVIGNSKFGLIISSALRPKIPQKWRKLFFLKASHLQALQKKTWHDELAENVFGLKVATKMIFRHLFGLDVLITDDWAVDRWHSLWSWRFTAMCSCSSCAETQQIYVPHV